MRFKRSHRLIQLVLIIGLLGLFITLADPEVAPTHAAVVNSYGAFGSQTYTTTSTCTDDTNGTYAITPGLITKKILPVGNGNFYLAGCFLDWAGIANADYLVYWNETSDTWSAVGAPGFNKGINDMIIYNGDLIVGGEFTDVAGISSADFVAKWNGSSWSALPNGLGSAPIVDLNASVSDLSIYPSDSSLVVAGRFTSGISNGDATYMANTLDFAKWNGATWSSVVASTPYNGDSGSSGSTEAAYYYPRSVTYVGSDIYIGGYRGQAYTTVAKAKMFVRYNATSSTWVNLGNNFSAWSFDNDGTQGYGIASLATLGQNVLLGGSFRNTAGNHFLSYNATSNTFSRFNNQTLNYITQGSGVRRISIWGSQVFVVGSFTGGTNTTASLLHWTGTSWQETAGYTSNISNEVVVDENWTGTSDRLMVGSNMDNIGGVASADQLASVELNGTSTLDSLTSTNSSPSLVYTGATSYSLSVPSSSASETIAFAASASASEMTISLNGSQFALTSGIETVALTVGSASHLDIKVTSTDGLSSTTYSVSILRMPEVTTTVTTTVAPTPNSVATTTTTVASIIAPNVENSTTTTTIGIDTRTVLKGKTLSIRLILNSKGVTIATGSKMTYKVASSSSKVCKVSGSSIKGVKTGTCKFSVVITPKKGKSSTKNLSITVR